MSLVVALAPYAWGILSVIVVGMALYALVKDVQS